MAATASETVENLTRLAIIISDAVQKKGSSTADWKAFLTSPEFAEIAESVTRMVSTIRQSDVAATIQAINDKQSSLKGSRSLAELPTDKLIQYGELGNVKVVLAANQVADELNADFAGWLVDSALPVLVKAAPIVIPLLV